MGAVGFLGILMNAGLVARLSIPVDILIYDFVNPVLRV